MKLSKIDYHFFLRHKYLFILIFVAIILCVKNYTPGTWLTGWDTLHPEFNFPLNLQRIVFGVWRQEQGLGAVAIHSHMSELPRILFLWLASVVLPTSFLRYFYVFICLVLGPVGVYYFLREVSLKKLHLRGHAAYIEPAAFLGALFYLLNLVTLQQFNVPFEMFTAQYAVLGWLFWIITRLLFRPTRKDWLWLILITFLAAPQAYAATLFYALFLALLIYLGTLILLNRQHWCIGAKRAFWILMVVLAVNSFWLLPNVYAVLFHSADVENSKVNTLFSQQAFLFNQAYGNFTDVAILRGFLFGWTQWMGNNNFDYVLNIWRSFITLPILVLFYGVFGVVIGGIVYTIKKRPTIEVALLPVGLVCMVFLMNANPPFSWIFDLIRNHASLFKEALRTPYTKFSIILLFVYVVYFAEGVAWIIHYLVQTTKRSWMKYGIVTLVAICFVVMMWPAFSGNLINPTMRLKIPQEYFALNQWFSEQPNDGRVMELPLPSFWNWTYYDWGYQGAGFIWFGIKQPVLDRDFDRWSGYNEEYYREMSYAVYSQNLSLFESLLEKYQVRYLLFDQYVVAPGNDPKELYLTQIASLLKSSKKIHLAKSFSIKTAVYEFDLQNTFANASQVGTPEPNVLPIMQRNFIDQAYQSLKSYISTMTKIGTTVSTAQVNFPLRDFILPGDQVDTNALRISGNNYTVTLHPSVPQGPLQVPNYLTMETFLPADVYASRTNTSLIIQIVYGLPWPSAQTRPYSILVLPLAASASNVVLANDQSQPLTVPNKPSSTMQLLGRVTLSTKHDNTIALYTPQTSAATTLHTTEFPVTPDRCSAPDAQQIFGAQATADGRGIVMISNNTITCVSIALKSTNIPRTVFQQSGTALLQFDFDYQPGNGPAPYYCLYDQIAQQCVYTSYGNPVQLVTSPDHFTDYVSVTPTQLAHDSIRLFLDSVNAKDQRELTVSNLTVAFASPLSTASLTVQTMQAAITTQPFTLKPDSETTLEGFLPENSSSIVNDVTRINRHVDSCSSIVPKDSSRQNVANGNNRYIAYSALEGTSCDHFDFPSLPHDRAYVVAINAQYVEGLPLQVCVSNDNTRRCDIYTELGETKQFTPYYILVPPNTSPGFGYDIDINDYSIGNLRSTNDVKGIHVYDFPQNWLQAIQVETPARVAQPQEQVRVGVGPTTFGKGILSSSSQPTTHLVVVNQAYERGWLLFRLVGGVLPWPVQAQHVLVNNWQNGWLVQTASGSSQQTVYVYFVPQLLYYLGVAFGLVTTGYCLRRSNWRRTWHKLVNRR